jgi:hypothetical protein
MTGEKGKRRDREESDTVSHVFTFLNASQSFAAPAVFFPLSLPPSLGVDMNFVSHEITGHVINTGSGMIRNFNFVPTKVKKRVFDATCRVVCVH